jgi:DNA-binding SARP family transcriptional activator
MTDVVTPKWAATDAGRGKMRRRAPNNISAVLLLVGLPVALLRLAGWPLPTSPPSKAHLAQWLDQPLTHASVTGAITLAAWGIWSLLLAAAVTDLYGWVCRRCRMPHLTPPRPLQMLAAALLGTTAASATISTPAHGASTATGSGHDDTGHRSPAARTWTDHTQPAAAGRGAAPPPGPSATVDTGVGDDTPVRAAAVRNPATAGSATTGTGPTGPAATTVRRAPGVRLPVYEVARGDWMVKVAQRFLGDEDRYVDIERLNPQWERQDHRFPDHWEPGWRVVLPADAHDAGPRRHAAGRLTVTTAPAPPTTTPPGRPQPTRPAHTPSPPPPRSPSTAPSASASPAPSTSLSPSPGEVVPQPTTPASPAPSSASPSAGHSGSSPSSSNEPPANAPDTHDGHGVDLPGGWVALPLAAAVVAAATTVWRRRRHRYLPRPVRGEPLDDPDLQPLPSVVTRLRHAVREQTPELLRPPTPASPTVADYRTADAGHRPQLPPVGPSGLDLAGLADRVPPGGLGLVGPGAEAAARGLLVATLSAGTPADPDAKGQLIIPADALTTLLGADAVHVGDILRLTVTASLSEALTHTEELLIQRRRLLEDSDVPDLPAMRAADPYHPPMPPVLLLAETPPAELRARLTTTLHLGGPLQITAVLLGDWPRGNTLTVADDGRTVNTGSPRLSILDVPTTLHLLHTLREAHTGEPTATAPADSPAAADLLTPPPLTDASAEQTPETPTHNDDDAVDRPPAPATPDAAASTAVAAAHTAADSTEDSAPATKNSQPRPARRQPVRIRLLGEPMILDRDGNPVPGLRHHARELLVYLAVHRGGADLSQIMEAFWPTATVRRASERLSTEAGDLRRRIRQAAGDRDIQPVVNTGGRYHLNPDLVDLDVWRLVDTLRQAAATTDAAARGRLLRHAVDTHTGPLADGHDYDWIEQPREQLRRHGIRARLDLAALLADTQPREAADLTHTAAALDPINEDLARQAMRALARVGDADAVRAVLHQLRTALDDIDEEPSSETIALAAHLQRRISSRAGTDDEPGSAGNHATP